jgi:hypothetical protein
MTDEIAIIKIWNCLSVGATVDEGGLNNGDPGAMFTEHYSPPTRF